MSKDDKNKKDKEDKKDKKHEEVNRFELCCSFTNWLQGFWYLLGGHFRKRIGADVEQYTFTETGCQTIEISDHDQSQKVWFSVSQPKDGDPVNVVSFVRNECTITIYANIVDAPCHVKWMSIC